MIRENVEIDLLLETGGGGAGRHVLDLFHGLRSAGWNAHLILSSRRADQLFTAEVAEIPRELITYLEIHRSPHMSDIPAVMQLRRYIARSGRRHLIHAHSTKAGMLGWALRGTYGRVFTPHTYRSMDTTMNQKTASAIRRVEIAYSRPYNRIVAVSPYEKSYIGSRIASPERVCYIPNGVDAAGIRALTDKVRAGRAANNPPVIGFVGRLVYAKKPELLIETLRVLKERNVEMRAVIVGDGPLRGSMEAVVERYGLSHRIEWLGEKPSLEELGRMDLTLHTSRYESCPYTLLEAAAAGVPTIAVENAGSRGIFGDYLPEAIVGSATPEALADGVMRVLRDDAIRIAQMHGLEAVARRFTIENMVKATAAVYDEVLNQPARGHAR